ncbi:hypothetical protein [Pasteuria penetrans]|uniref:hypothetical protein n=1 Tax=Pasteuria penetrans TaxID=86005 RepID=UPI000FC38D33|nr:hypothetical protein [Pasteuria penetrans]
MRVVVCSSVKNRLGCQDEGVLGTIRVAQARMERGSAYDGISGCSLFQKKVREKEMIITDNSFNKE